MEFLGIMLVAAVAFFGWIVFWFYCIKGLVVALRPIFGESSLVIALVGFPILFGGISLGLVSYLGRDAFGWLMAAFGVVLAVIGGVALRNLKELK